MAEARLQALPFAEAIQALKERDRERLPSGHWSSVWESEHAVAFTVARSSGFDILSDIHESLTKALSEGTTFDAWKKDITPVLQAKGWWGKREIDGEVVQLGSPRRLATIFQVNMRVSHMAGKWDQIQRLKDRRPWLRYVAVLDERTRANHRSLHGTVLPVDHPFWDSHFPPNGWRCRCTVEQLSDRDLARYGYRPTDPPPPVRLATWRRPATGDIVVTPQGIDPGWGHNVGRARETATAALRKLADAPPALAAQAWQVMPTLMPAVAAEFRTWAAEALVPTYRQTGEWRPVTLLSPRVVERLERMGVQAPSSAVVMIDDKQLRHLMRTTKVNRGAALPKAAAEDLARHMQAPAGVLWDSRSSSLVYWFPVDDGSGGRAAIKLDHLQRVPPGRARQITNLLVTAGLEDLSSLRSDRYVLLQGKKP